MSKSTTSRSLPKFLTVSGFVATFMSLAQTAQAQITNPAVGDFGRNASEAESGKTFLFFFTLMWRAIINVGALAVIVLFLWGAIDWIVAGGDQGKVGKARDKITNAAIGMVLLVGSFVLIGFFGQVFFGENFDILNLTFPSPNGASQSGTPSLPNLNQNNNGLPNGFDPGQVPGVNDN